MTEQAETPKILEEISKSNSANASGRSTRKQLKARRRFTAVIVMLLPLVAAVLFVGYQQISLQSQLVELAVENQQLTQNLDQQTVQLRQLEQNQQQVPEPVEIDDAAVRELEFTLTEEIEQLRTQLADLQTQRLSANSATSQEWKIFEAEYLIGIASQKLQLEGDVVTASAQLQRADQALLDSGSSNVFAVRQAIAAELQQLRNIELLDREGIYLQLNNLLVEMAGIDLLNSMRTEFENQRNAESEPLGLEATEGEAEGAAEGAAETSGYLESSLDFLSSIFIWREWEETPQAMLAAGQDELVKQNLSLMLEQAQLALLMRDNGLYQQALIKSKGWLQRYAVIDTEQGRTLLAALDKLAGYDIDPILPLLNQSLLLIRQLTASER